MRTGAYSSVKITTGISRINDSDVSLVCKRTLYTQLNAAVSPWNHKKITRARGRSKKPGRITHRRVILRFRGVSCSLISFSLRVSYESGLQFLPVFPINMISYMISIFNATHTEKQTVCVCLVIAACLLMCDTREWKERERENLFYL